MKIAVWILSDYKHQIGGGFALYDKFIQLIDNYEFSPDIEVCFVGHNSAKQYNFKKKYIELKFFGTASSSLFKLFQKICARFSHRIPFLNKHERSILDKNEVDVVFYPVQGFRKIPNFPFVVSNWDIGHKASYAFPELGMNYSFNYRDKWYSNGIFKALFVFAESDSGRAELINYTKLNPERIRIVPLFPGGVVDLKVEENIQQTKLSEIGLVSKKFFFYPAQFWAHKNHYNLLKSFKKLTEEYPDYKLVFTGSDKGNKSYIVDASDKLGLKKHVIFTGFISNETMVALYSNACAMIMPSFLGPTNMPLLEARLLNCPVLCSNLSGHKEIMEEGAIYFDPTNPDKMATAMKTMTNDVERNKILSIAESTIASTKFSSDRALKDLEMHFRDLIPIRSAWGRSNNIF